MKCVYCLKKAEFVVQGNSVCQNHLKEVAIQMERQNEFLKRKIQRQLNSEIEV